MFLEIRVIQTIVPSTLALTSLNWVLSDKSPSIMNLKLLTPSMILTADPSSTMLSSWVKSYLLWFGATNRISVFPGLSSQLRIHNWWWLITQDSAQGCQKQHWGLAGLTDWSFLCTFSKVSRCESCTRQSPPNALYDMQTDVETKNRIPTNVP